MLPPLGPSQTINTRLMFIPTSLRLPADCQHAVLSLSDQLNVAQDIFCACGSAFCFNCKEEAHRPVNCETVRKWMVRSRCWCQASCGWDTRCTGLLLPLPVWP